MSVFVTLWNRDGKPVEPGLPKSMLAAELNPHNDGMDIWLGDYVAFAHQHFWLTPEEVGEQQPITDPITRAVIVGSIRLDNRKELLNSLGILNSEANHLSDAQLILLMYRQWGVQCPSRLLGDFAFAIWDPMEQRIFAARDQLGSEEIVYYLDTSLLIMASSIKLILQHPAVQKKLNETTVANYLAVNFSDNVNTFYQSIFHLPPAHYFSLSTEKSTIQCYWQLDPEKTTLHNSDSDYADHYQELITGAVKAQLRSAYPVGISLSGGLDSSSLACVMAELMAKFNPIQNEIGCYSYVFDQLTSCDEKKYIDSVFSQMSKHFPVKQQQLNGDLLYPAPFNQDWQIQPDFPFNDPYAYLIRSILMAAQADKVRNLISGFSGDTLYSGGNYFFADLLQEGRLPYAIKTYFQYIKFIQVKKHLVDYGIRALVPSKIKRLVRSILPSKPAWNAWIDESFTDSSGIKDSETYPEELIRFHTPGQQYRYNDLFFIGLSLGITTYKKIAWQYGLEYQFPFFSLKIIEFILSIPSDQVNLPGVPRRILRNAMVNKLPELVRRRRTKTTLDELFQKGLYQISWQKVTEYLTNSQVMERGWIKRDWLTQELQKETCTQGGFILWMVLSLELWLQKYWNS